MKPEERVKKGKLVMIFGKNEKQKLGDDGGDGGKK